MGRLASAEVPVSNIYDISPVVAWSNPSPAPNSPWGTITCLTCGHVWNKYADSSTVEAAVEVNETLHSCINCHGIPPAA